MDILIPHEGLTNEKICQTQIEMLDRKQNEFKLIGMGQCKVDGTPAYYNDEACKDFVELQK